jgi:hypothetical protein
MLGARLRRGRIGACQHHSLFRRTLTNRHDGQAASWPVIRRTFNVRSVTNVSGAGHVMSCRTFLLRESECGWHMLLRVSR